MKVKRYESGCNNILRDWKCPEDYEAVEIEGWLQRLKLSHLFMRVL